MTKKELVDNVCKTADVTKKDAESVISATFAVIEESMKKGEKIAIPGFGIFSVKVQGARPAKQGRNPKTGEVIEIAARPEQKAPKFAASKALKEMVKNS